MWCWSDVICESQSGVLRFTNKQVRHVPNMQKLRLKTTRLCVSSSPEEGHGACPEPREFCTHTCLRDDACVRVPDLDTRSAAGFCGRGVVGDSR